MYDGVDKSYDQCRLANYVVTGGDEDCLTDGIRFRRRLPEGTGNHREQYNMVLVQNVLGDQRSRKERLLLLDRLWSKVHVNGGIMVIIDSGNLPGHELTQVLFNCFKEKKRSGSYFCILSNSHTYRVVIVSFISNELGL